MKINIKESLKKEPLQVAVLAILILLLGGVVYVVATHPGDYSRSPWPEPPRTDTIAYRTAYDAGWKDGSLVGRTDAKEGRARDGQKAMRLAKIHAEGRPEAKAYERGYHRGYNGGWHAVMKIYGQ